MWTEINKLFIIFVGGYDCYKFSVNGRDMYNPYSIVNVMAGQEFRNITRILWLCCIRRVI